MTFSYIHHIVLILLHLSPFVLSSHPVLNIPLSQTNAASPSFTITEVLDLNGGATLMPMPNAPSMPQVPPMSPIDPLLTIIPPPPSPKDGEIANHPTPKEKNLPPEALMSQRNSSSPSFLDDATFQKDVLNSTNTIRELHSAHALTWNTTLAASAQNKSALCRPHSSRQTIHGETIAVSKNNVTEAIESWNLPNKSKLEKLKTDLTTFNLTALEKDLSPKTLAKHLATIKSFTQLIWKNTTSLGCGRTFCGGKNDILGWLIICEFDPKGNIIGQFGENVQLNASTTSAERNGNAAGQIGAGSSKGRPNAGAIGEAKNAGVAMVDRMQVWGVFVVVWFVFAAILS
jgi:hypothetical protein